MPTSIPGGITRDHILAALAELDRGVVHPFGEPTAYELIHEGKSYPPKAAIGIAARFAFGQILEPSQFSSGVKPGQAIHFLRQLGFEVKRTANDWNEAEVRFAVDDYFEMLQMELQDQSFDKTAHRRLLAQKIPARSSGSIEFKHQNISAVLVALGLPYIDGYKPRDRFQNLLYTVVEEYLAQHPAFFENIGQTKRLNPCVIPQISASARSLFVAPPEHFVIPKEHSKPWLSKRGRRIDFARRDIENKRLGELGENFVVEVEKKRLIEAGRDDLAANIEWVARTCGDGLGYDVLSFNETNDQELWLEVKTTGLGKYFPFYVTRNEVACSEAEPQRYALYRVFNFSSQAQLFVLPGSISQTLSLEPVQYRAFLGAKDGSVVDDDD